MHPKDSQSENPMACFGIHNYIWRLKQGLNLELGEGM
jgi:hypothetical protein